MFSDSVKLLSLLVVLFALVFANDVVRISPFENVAALPTGSDYGIKLGQTVHDTVLNIRANIPNSQITHADVLGIMCVENPRLSIGTCAGANDCGLTQVIPSTYQGLVHGNMAGGRCRYIQKLEGGACASRGSLTTNPRCSIEIGACLFNDHLRSCNGDRGCAYNSYNAGPRGRSPYVGRFMNCYQALAQGQMPSKAANNPGVWRAMVQRVAQLTNNTFKTDDARHVTTSGWPAVAADPQQRLQQISQGWFRSNNGSNPISSFLGLQPASTQTSSSLSQTLQTPAGYLDPNRNPALRPENDPSQRRTNTNTGSAQVTNRDTSNSVNNPSSDDSSLRDASDSPSDTNSANASSEASIANLHNTTPTLLCLPSPVGAGETALIMWACRDGAYKTEGENIDTNNQTIGSVKVTPTQTTTYTVTCINDIKNVDNTAASCQIDVANPALALIATPNTASRGQTVTLSWKTKDTTSCTLTSNDHPTYTRSGVEGDAVSPTLTRNTTFTLECETTTGETLIKETTVGVN